MRIRLDAIKLASPKRLWIPCATLMLGVLAMHCAVSGGDVTTGLSGEEAREALKGKKYFLSDLDPISDSNGWGDIEFDMSNGERKQNDGHKIKLAGNTYARGLGVHAPSNVLFKLNGRCSLFRAVVGIDDETQRRGSVVFKVIVDDDMENPAYESDVLTGGGETDTVKIDLNGAKTLRLVVEDAGDGKHHDHADWADAYVRCDKDPRRGDSDPTEKGNDSSGNGTTVQADSIGRCPASTIGSKCGYEGKVGVCQKDSRPEYIGGFCKVEGSEATNDSEGTSNSPASDGTVQADSIGRCPSGTIGSKCSRDGEIGVCQKDDRPEYIGGFCKTDKSGN